MTEPPVGTGAESHILMADLIVVHFLYTLRSDRRPMANEPR